MKFEDAVNKIKKYFNSSACTPIIVDIQNIYDFDKLQEEFPSTFYSYVPASTYCKKDSVISIEDLEEDISKRSGKIFLTNLSTFLKLEGKEYLKTQVRELLELQVPCHVVILTYQCKEYFNFSDKRLFAALKIIVVDGKKEQTPNIIFVAPHLLPESTNKCIGIDHLGYSFEHSSQPLVWIETNNKISSFPQSTIKLKELVSSFDILKNYINNISDIDKNFGTQDQWNTVLTYIHKYGSWDNLITSLFGGRLNLTFLINEYQNFDKDKKWLYILSLKLLKNDIQNTYLKSVVDSLQNCAEFQINLLKNILNIKVTDSCFYDLYQERKILLKSFGEETELVCEYCKFVQSKGKNALYYLTDCTIQEKELIIYLLNQYASEIKAEECSSLLKIIYPDLYYYLQPYDFDNQLLNGYFQAYKLQKLFNRITPEFKKIVEEQALNREYNVILRPRTSYIEKINKNNTLVYFVDALGVEYLSYLMNLCKEKNLFAKVTVCRSELPSITCMNKEFIELFQNAGCQVINIKALDEVKHHGKNNCDYQTVKEPIHLIEELSILTKLMENIRVKLASSSCERAIIISDHGASRLAVINETENKYEMAEKGLHSGRCCPRTDIDTQPEYSTEEHGYWVLANYDRFKGGRKANVEVHGGASLEEICVPIIEVLSQDDSITVELIPEYKVIVASYRKVASIKLFINKKIFDVKVRIDGIYYDAQQTTDEFVYQVDMADIRKSRTYHFDVFWKNNMIASNMEFVVKNEVTVEKDLF